MSGINPLLQGVSYADPREIYLPERYTDLLAAIIRSGLQSEGLEYLGTPGGKYWCWVGDLDPGAVKRQAVNNGYWGQDKQSASGTNIN